MFEIILSGLVGMVVGSFFTSIYYKNRMISYVKEVQLIIAEEYIKMMIEMDQLKNNKKLKNRNHPYINNKPGVPYIYPTAKDKNIENNTATQVFFSDEMP